MAGVNAEMGQFLLVQNEQCSGDLRDGRQRSTQASDTQNDDARTPKEA
jgi:hypothetical protein